MSGRPYTIKIDDLIDRPEWMMRTDLACKQPDAPPTHVFYPQRGASTAPAKAVCATCPARVECEEWGIVHEHHGIWGGLSERERRLIRRQRAIKRRILDPIEHGTDAGYAAHRTRGEEACPACKEAHALYQQHRRPSRAKPKAARGAA